ncbi:MAG: GNAT family N-acetyltransferase [Microcoleaceae cyanobacterium]
MITLRPAVTQDIDFILAQEARDDFRQLIGRYSQEEHQQNLQDPNKCYLMIEDDHQKTLGFVILNDINSEHRSILLQRIAIAEPGKGHGKQALRLVIKKVFEEYNAHRFWLDVFVENSRARHVYKSLGFQEEGILRDAWRQEGIYASQAIMSILEHEYRALED